MEYQIPVPTSLSVVPVNFNWAAQRDVGGIPKGHKTRTLEIRIIRDGSHAKNDDSWRASAEEAREPTWLTPRV